MGTRGALGFIRNGEHKVTYNHYDSYPSELGKNVILYLENRGRDLKNLNEDFDAITMVNEDDTPTTVQKQLCKDNGLFDDGVATQSDDDWYCLLREGQGLLESNVKVGFMIDSEEFLSNSLFCEYAYIINLDTERLEFYTGFEKDSQGYGGVHLIGEFPIESVTMEDYDKAQTAIENGENLAAIFEIEMED
jgi:hypothetical protein